MIPIGEEDLPSPIAGSTAPSHITHEPGQRARVFQGGRPGPGGSCALPGLRASCPACRPQACFLTPVGFLVCRRPLSGPAQDAGRVQRQPGAVRGRPHLCRRAAQVRRQSARSAVRSLLSPAAAQLLQVLSFLEEAEPATARQCLHLPVMVTALTAASPCAAAQQEGAGVAHAAGGARAGCGAGDAGALQGDKLTGAERGVGGGCALTRPSSKHTTATVHSTRDPSSPCARISHPHVQGNMQELGVLRKQRDALDDQIQRLEWQLRYMPLGERRPRCARGPPRLRCSELVAPRGH